MKSVTSIRKGEPDMTTLPKRDVLNLYGAILSLGSVSATAQFCYAMGRTRRSLLPEFEAINEAQRAVQQRATALEDGPEKRAQIEALQTELNALLASDATVQLFTVDWSLVPELTVAQIDGLWPLLTGEPAA